MKAHDFEDGGGLVTGTHDVAAASALMRQHSHDLTCGDAYSHDADSCMDADWVTAEDAVLESGRFIPDSQYGGGWSWRGGYKLGVPGVTRAVVWHV